MARCRQRRLPILVLEHAGDPQIPGVMPDNLASSVHQTAAIAGEHSAIGDIVQVAERINAVG